MSVGTLGGSAFGWNCPGNRRKRGRASERKSTFHPHLSVPGAGDLMVNPTGTSSSACRVARLWQEVPMCSARKPRGEDFCVCVCVCVCVSVSV